LPPYVGNASSSSALVFQIATSLLFHFFNLSANSPRTLKLLPSLNDISRFSVLNTTVCEDHHLRVVCHNSSSLLSSGNASSAHASAWVQSDWILLSVLVIVFFCSVTVLSWRCLAKRQRQTKIAGLQSSLPPLPTLPTHASPQAALSPRARENAIPTPSFNSLMQPGAVSRPLAKASFCSPVEAVARHSTTAEGLPPLSPLRFQRSNLSVRKGELTRSGTVAARSITVIQPSRTAAEIVTGEFSSY
jgi:hypothetical protein